MTIAAGHEDKLFIFGSTGDLVRRYVLPALEEVHAQHPSLKIVALGRRPFSGIEYAEFACPAASLSFKRAISYARIDFEGPNVCDDCEQHFSAGGMNYFYLSLPPRLLDNAIEYIYAVQSLGYKVRILAEKPFGANHAHATTLMKKIHDFTLADRFYIADHYLFKQSILAARKKFAGVSFSTLKVYSFESLGLEGREYYDSVGAINDMLQSHLLNIAALFFDICSLASATVSEIVVGQFAGYDIQVGKSSETETFFYLTLTVGEKRFYFSSGKKLYEKKSILQIDNHHIDFTKDKGAYAGLFTAFLKEQKELFPTMECAVVAWSIIEKVKSNKPPVFIYPEHAPFESLVDENTMHLI